MKGKAEEFLRNKRLVCKFCGFPTYLICAICALFNIFALFSLDVYVSYEITSV